MSRANKYAAWQLSSIDNLNGLRVLEVGTGVGNLTEHLVKNHHEVVTIEPNEDAFNLARIRIAAAPNVTILHLALADLNPRIGKFDLVVMTNVLEHIEDDAGALRGLRSFLNEGGYLFVLVPAHPVLFGSLDSEVGHFRRYTKASLRGILRSAGFEPSNLNYMNMLGAIGWFINYKLFRLRGTNANESSGQVWFFERFLVPSLRVIETWIRPMFGLSVLATSRVKSIGSQR